ncbi:GNAT family N-acetyltransferase [Roseomonas sp. E05]|uniref:GNAT family N-acetyltransferase n=1 Tax=Roseomonas sp. E05 TaxID=3046310 RepID=UPI0024BB4927|nr:GNAT family N-acetyltransferase [Roseomonas sp. E05]MDJ0391419.1 GNAT family N-acetyltransferase [Roseomonas sp. E05]
MPGAGAIVIREGRAEDAPWLAAIHRRARQAAMPGLREVHDEADVAGWIATTLMRAHRVMVAEQGGMPVGYIGFGRDARHGPMVLHLYLAPDHRGQGIGALLLKAAADALGPQLSLYCIARNAGALRFYRRQGFRVVACSDGAGTEEGEPDLLLSRDALSTECNDREDSP